MKDKFKELEHERETERLKHDWKLQEIEFERKCKIEVERLSHENRLGEIRFKKASIDITQGRR